MRCVGLEEMHKQTRRRQKEQLQLQVLMENKNASSAGSQGMSRRTVQTKAKVEIPITKVVEVAMM